MFRSIFQTVTSLADLKAAAKNTWVEAAGHFVGYWECTDGEWRWHIHTGDNASDEDNAKAYQHEANFLRHNPEFAELLAEGLTIKMYVMDYAFMRNAYDVEDEAA